MKKAEITFMIEELTKDLVKNIMDEHEVSLSKALDIVYTSETFRNLCNPATGLYFQSTNYVYAFLDNELKYGDPIR